MKRIIETIGNGLKDSDDTEGLIGEIQITPEYLQKSGELKRMAQEIMAANKLEDGQVEFFIPESFRIACKVKVARKKA